MMQPYCVRIEVANVQKTIISLSQTIYQHRRFHSYSLNSPDIAIHFPSEAAKEKWVHLGKAAAEAHEDWDSAKSSGLTPPHFLETPCYEDNPQLIYAHSLWRSNH